MEQCFLVECEAFRGGLAMKLKCPKCGSTNISIITSDDRNMRYMCESCSTTGNRELFTATDNNQDKKEFWT